MIGEVNLKLPSVETIARAIYRHWLKEEPVYLDWPDGLDAAVDRGWPRYKDQAKAVLDAVAENIDISIHVGKPTGDKR